MIEIPDIVKVWKIGGKTGNLRSQNKYDNNTGYSLFCQTNNKYLTWKKMPAGFNVDFINDSEVKKTHLRLPDGKERDILSGELVALGIGGGDAFLRYAHRTVGINLKWEENPVFQWRIFSTTGQVGAPIKSGDLVAIRNEKVEPNPDFLIFLDRPTGLADIGWTSSPEFFNKIGNAAIKVGIEAAKKYVGLP